MKKVMYLPKVGASRMFLLLAILFIGEMRTFAQLRIGNEPSRPSADSWEMVKYGEIEPSLYTGTINLQIPFYTYKDNDFEIPVNFNYASNGCIPNSRPGVLGPGWVLEAGGVVTREIRGIPDNVDENSLAVGFWYPFSLSDTPTSRCYSATQYPVFYMSQEQPNTYTIQDDEIQKQLFHNSVMYTTGELDGSTPDEDAEPDIFHFNFMGYSGCFHLGASHSIVVFDTNFNSQEMKVDIQLNQSYTVLPLNFTNTAPSVAETDRFISITFTDSKGYRYVFNGATTNSGNNPNNDCSNLDILYSTPANYETIYAPADILAWHISKIIAPNGRTVRFDYGRSSPMKCVRPATFSQTESCVAPGNTLFHHDILTTNSYSVSENALLQSIVLDNGTSIHFNYGSDYYDSFQIGAEQCKRLEKATALFGSDTIKTATISYINAKNSADPFLSKISISGEGNYLFSYLNMSSFPSIGETRQDYWGYYNGKTEIPTPIIDPNDTSDVQTELAYIQEFNSHLKESDPYFGSIGLINRIDYPTGGYSCFDYTGNTFSKAVVRTEANHFHPVLTDTTSLFGCGGVRLSRIRDYDSDANLLIDRQFTYTLNDGRSSGILTYFPLYEYNYECVGSTANTVLAGMGFASIILYGQVIGHVESNSLTRYNSTHIEYSRVIETRGDGSSIEYDYSTSADSVLVDCLLPSNIHMDLGYSMPQNSLFHACRAVAQVTSLQSLRGNLISKKNYNDNGVLLQEEYSHYGNRRSSYLVDYCRLIRCCANRFTFTGDDKLIGSEVSTHYGDEASVNITTNYTYNSLGLLSSSYETDSKGKISRKEFSYVSDLSTNPIERSMYDKNVIRYPVSERDYYDGILIKETVTTFCKPDTSKHFLFRPSSIIETDCIEGTVLTTQYSYDNKGNLIGVIHPDGTCTSIVWGYGGLYPVAIIDGCQPENVISIHGFEDIADSPLPSGLGTLETFLRAGLPATAEASTFQYLPLVGLVKETSPDGRHTEYIYNNNGKLKSILDCSGNRLKYYFYSPDNKQSSL